MELKERYAADSDKVWLWTIYRHLLKPSITAQWGWNEDFQQQYFETDLPVHKFVIYSKSGIDVAASLVNNEPDHYYVKMLLVLNEFQGIGVGRVIMDRLKTKAELDSKAIRLSVIKAHNVAGFYRKLGFDIIGEHDGSIKYQYAPSIG